MEAGHASAQVLVFLITALPSAKSCLPLASPLQIYRLSSCLERSRVANKQHSASSPLDFVLPGAVAGMQRDHCVDFELSPIGESLQRRTAWKRIENMSEGPMQSILRLRGPARLWYFETCSLRNSRISSGWNCSITIPIHCCRYTCSP